MEYKATKVNLLLRYKFTVVCVIAGALLVALLSPQCASDSKTTYSYDPSSTVATRVTPSPVESPVPAPSPRAAVAAPAKPTPTPFIEPTSGESEELLRHDMLAADKSITYEKLKKNADEYHGKVWAFTGKVSQIQEGSGRTVALVSLGAWGSKMMWVTADFTTEFVENNQVYVVGYLSGDYSYESVAGWNVTVPAIEATAILKPSEAARIRAGKPPAKK